MPRKRDSEEAELSRRVHTAVGRRISEIRSKKDLFQQEFARRMGLSRTSVSNIECGTRALFLDQVYQAADVLGVDAHELLPSMEEIFPTVAVHTANDDQVPEQDALKVIRRVEERLVRSRRGIAKRSRTS
jgi:transcriptional regulator with XRE-family HTH domain